MAQPRPAKNDREQWYVKNITDRTLAISDVLTIPAIGPGKTIDILRFATREQISYSNVLPQLVKMGKVTFRKSIPDSGIDDAVTADTVDASIVPRQYADGEHVEGAESAGASTVGELEDIDLTGLLDDQVLQYDASTETWRPVDLSVLGSYGSSDFSNDFALKTTTDLSEGSNLYYTQARFDSALGAKSTDDLSEGSNLYYSQGRFDSAFSAKSTSDLSEGTNLYYQDERVDDRIASILRNGTGISWTYDDGNNELTANVSLAPFSTTNLSEGTNLYYTQARFDAAFAAKSTDDLTEGTSEFYTPEKVDDRVAALIQNGTGISWTYVDAAGTLTANISLSSFSTDDLSEGSNLYYTQGRFDSAFAAKSTTDLSEGTNQFYTNERVDDRVAALLTEGTNISLTYNDVAGTLTIDSSAGGLANIVEDTTPQLGGTLDAQSNSITNVQNITLSGTVDGRDISVDGTKLDSLDSSRQLPPGGTADQVLEKIDGTDYNVQWADPAPGYTSTDFDTDFAAKTTDDLAEGSAQFYTAERVDDRVASLLVAGSNVNIVYNDIAGTLTISSSGGPGGGAGFLNDLDDVDTTGGVADGDVLTYVGGQGEWQPASPSRNPDIIAYNPDGSISQIDFDTGAVMTFGYSGGRLETITEGSTVKTLQYNGDGQLTGIVVS